MKWNIQQKMPPKQRCADLLDKWGIVTYLNVNIFTIKKQKNNWAQYKQKRLPTRQGMGPGLPHKVNDVKI